MNFSSILQQWIATIAIHRDNYGDKSVSKNDAIFCNPLYWIAKNGIVFAYRHVWRPAAASGKIGN
jgi:hypothetical protein